MVKINSLFLFLAALILSASCAYVDDGLVVSDPYSGQTVGSEGNSAVLPVVGAADDDQGLEDEGNTQGDDLSAAQGDADEGQVASEADGEEDEDHEVGSEADVLLSEIDLADLQSALQDAADSEDSDSDSDADADSDSDEDSDEDSRRRSKKKTTRRTKKTTRRTKKSSSSSRSARKSSSSRKNRRSSGDNSPLAKNARDLTDGLLDGNFVRSFSGSMGMMNALGDNSADAQALNPHAMMLMGMMHGLSPGIPNFKKLKNDQLKAHLNALTQAMNMMMMMSGCYHTFSSLGMMPGVAMAMQPGGLPQAPFSTNALSPMSMIHPALNPMNPNSPMNPFFAHHQAIASAGMLFHQLQNAAAQAAAPPQQAMAPIVMQPLQGQAPQANMGPMHIFSTGGPAYLSNTNPAPMNIQHMYHYNAMAAQPAFGNPIAQQGQLGAALAGGF